MQTLSGSVCVFAMHMCVFVCVCVCVCVHIVAIDCMCMQFAVCILGSVIIAIISTDLGA